MKKSAEIDWSTVGKMMAGGAMAGAGTASVVSLLRYLQDLRTRAAQTQRPDTAWDDDVVYVNLPPRTKGASDGSNTAATFAFGGLGGLLGTLLSYNLVRDLYHKQRKRQLQGDIDKAQQIYLDRLSPVKEASGQFSTLTKGVGSAWLLALLTTLGSAVVSNRVLSAKYPALKSPNRDKPRKVVIRRTPAGAPAEETVDNVDGTPEATEALLRNHLANKTASHASGMADLVAAVSHGRGDEVLEALGQGGLDGLFAVVKGASAVESPLFKRDLAATWVAARPGLSDAVRPLLAAEFQAAHPGEYDVICKLAARDSEIVGEQLSVLAQLAVEVNRDRRADRWRPALSKSASADMLGLLPGPLDTVGVANELANLLTVNNETETEQPASTLASASSRESTPITQHKKGLDFEMDDEAALDFARHHGDAIDGVLRKNS